MWVVKNKKTKWDLIEKVHIHLIKPINIINNILGTNQDVFLFLGIIYPLGYHVLNFKIPVLFIISPVFEFIYLDWFLECAGQHKDSERHRLIGEGILAVLFYSSYFTGESNFLAINLIVYFIFWKNCSEIMMRSMCLLGNETWGLEYQPQLYSLIWYHDYSVS